MNWMIIAAVSTIIIILGYLLYNKLTKWIDKGETGAKYLTRLTMFMFVISFLSLTVASIGLIMNALIFEDTHAALLAQIQGTPKVLPDLNISLVNEDYVTFIESAEVFKIDADANWSFVYHPPVLQFYVRNNGQGDTGHIDVALTDEEQFFGTKYGNINNIEFNKFQQVKIPLTYSECYGGLRGEEKYKEIKKKCNEEASNLTVGVKRFYAQINCPSCQTSLTPTCYTFFICLYNASYPKEWCKEQWSPDMAMLKPVACPAGYWR